MRLKSHDNLWFVSDSDPSSRQPNGAQAHVSDTELLDAYSQAVVRVNHAVMVEVTAVAS